MPPTQVVTVKDVLVPYHHVTIAASASACLRSGNSCPSTSRAIWAAHTVVWQFYPSTTTIRVNCHRHRAVNTATCLRLCPAHRSTSVAPPPTLTEIAHLRSERNKEHRETARHPQYLELEVMW